MAVAAAAATAVTRRSFTRVRLAHRKDVGLSSSSSSYVDRHSPRSLARRPSSTVSATTSRFDRVTNALPDEARLAASHRSSIGDLELEATRRSNVGVSAGCARTRFPERFPREKDCRKWARPTPIPCRRSDDPTWKRTSRRRRTGSGVNIR